MWFGLSDFPLKCKKKYYIMTTDTLGKLHVKETVSKSVKLEGDPGKFVTISAGNASSDYTLTLPDSSGAVGEALVWGTGGVKWKTVPTSEKNTSREPNSTDDDTRGHSVGSTWVNTANDKSYICVNNLTNNAIWRHVGSNQELFINSEVEFERIKGERVRIGDSSGPVQASGCIAIGNESALGAQGDDSMAIGSNSAPNGQGPKCIALGYEAGKNAPLTIQPTGSFYIGKECIRDSNAVFATTFHDSKVLHYETSTGEIYHTTTGAVKNNFDAGGAPSTTDDRNTGGYSVGSLWVDRNDGKSYICVDDATNAAKWLQTSSVRHNFSANTDPGGSDDSSPAKGYSIGSMWVNKNTKKSYICVDDATGNAKWFQTSSVKHNFTANTDPEGSDDSSLAKGYSIGSTWVNTSADRSYTCVDDMANNAKWIGSDQNLFKDSDVKFKRISFSGDTVTIGNASESSEMRISIGKGAGSLSLPVLAGPNAFWDAIRNNSPTIPATDSASIAIGVHSGRHINTNGIDNIAIGTHAAWEGRCMLL